MKSKKNKGLILIELLTSMAVFAIGVATIFSLFVGATQGAFLSLDRTNAHFITNEKLEAARSIEKNNPNKLIPGIFEVGINSQNEWELIPVNGLIAHFPLINDGNDSGPYNISTILNKISFSEDRKNQPFAAARFNGQDSFIQTKYGFPLQIEGPLTVSSWVLTVGGGRRNIVGRYNINQRQGSYLLFRENNQYHFQVSGPEGTSTVSATSDFFPWEHITGVFIPGKELRIYINGNLKGSTQTNISSINRSPEIEFSIGSDAGQSNIWEGLISDVRIYNRSLTSKEVFALSQTYSTKRTKHLKIIDVNYEKAGIWDFYEGENCVVHDNSGNNNHAIIKRPGDCLNNWKSNRFNTGHSISLGSDRLEISDNPTLRIENEISISAWIRLNALPDNDGFIVRKFSPGAEHISFALLYDGFNKGYQFTASLGTQFFDLPTIRAERTAVLNQWQHIVATFDGLNKKIYINGSLIETIQASSAITQTNNLMLAENIAGEVDDIRIYKKALDPEDVMNIFLGNMNYFLTD